MILDLLGSINVNSKLLILYKFKSFLLISFCFKSRKWSALYHRVPPAVDSVGVNSKEKFGIFIFFTMIISLSILVSEIAIMSKLILVDLIKYSRSSKFLCKEQLLMWNREIELFLSHNMFTLQHFQGLCDHVFGICYQID